MERYETGNIEEAVELAHDLKSKGRYNWFRGQVEEWPPVSSAYRINAGNDVEKRRKAERRQLMFFQWVGSIPELRYLQDKQYEKNALAIMQHYGIPTHFIDFTTDPGVAGFFAADTTTPHNDVRSCMYCLNTADLMAFWDVYKALDEREGALIELIEIDVSNLWRLQSQKGVFLLANYNWQIDYPMDVIIFPYSGFPSYPTREVIYPEHKSPLEQLLDQYFSLERSAFFNDEMREFFEGLRARGVNASMEDWNAFPGGFYEQAFPDKTRMVPLKSWSGESLQAWEINREEDYHQTVGPTISLKLKGQSDAKEIGKSVTFGVKQFLRADSTVRSKTVNWQFEGLPTSLAEDDLNDALRPLWNAMRRLPYVDNEIAMACGSVATLLVAGFRDDAPSSAQRQLFAQYFGEAIQVGFANQDGSGSQGFVALESLRKAMRSDLLELIAADYKEFSHLPDIFRIIYNPKLMFEFNEFKDLFAREVIPSQVLLKRDVLVTNPVRLITFGLP